MTNHVHLLATPFDEDSIPRTMQSVGRRYVQYFNYTYDRTGTLWEGRYKATLIDSAGYLLTCMRYIELNPVRAGMVNHPKDYDWSSYAFNAHGVDDELISIHRLYKSLGLDTVERQSSYRQLFKSRLPQSDIENIRDCTNKAWVLGSERFKKKIEKMTERRVKPKPRGRPRRTED